MGYSSLGKGDRGGSGPGRGAGFPGQRRRKGPGHSEGSDGGRAVGRVSGRSPAAGSRRAHYSGTVPSAGSSSDAGEQIRV